MEAVEFNNLKKKCPWYYIDANQASKENCMATYRGQSLDFTADDWSKACCKANCAVLYWVKMLLGVDLHD